MKTPFRYVLIVLFLVIATLPARAEMDRFMPKLGGTTEMWRLTNDPAERHHANYHNAQCWSPDGRYVCIYDDDEIHIYDLHTDRKRDYRQVGKDFIFGGGHCTFAPDGNWMATDGSVTTLVDKSRYPMRYASEMEPYGRRNMFRRHGHIKLDPSTPHRQPGRLAGKHMRRRAAASVLMLGGEKCIMRAG
jgi:hypothetical protein